MESKKCSRCGRKLPLTAFNRNKRNADGLQERCRECCSEYNRQRYASNPDRFKESARRRRNMHPDMDLATRIKACTKNPTKKNAYMALDAAVRAGVLTRPHVCSGCGCPDTEHRIEAHHYDYTKPLDVIWLCTPCHRRMDAQRRVREGKQPYARGREDARADVLGVR